MAITTSSWAGWTLRKTITLLCSILTLSLLCSATCNVFTSTQSIKSSHKLSTNALAHKTGSYKRSVTLWHNEEWHLVILWQCLKKMAGSTTMDLPTYALHSLPQFIEQVIYSLTSKVLKWHLGMFIHWPSTIATSKSLRNVLTTIQHYLTAR